MTMLKLASAFIIFGVLAVTMSAVLDLVMIAWQAAHRSWVRRWYRRERR